MWVFKQMALYELPDHKNRIRESWGCHKILNEVSFSQFQYTILFVIDCPYSFLNFNSKQLRFLIIICYKQIFPSLGCI